MASDPKSSTAGHTLGDGTFEPGIGAALGNTNPVQDFASDVDKFAHSSPGASARVKPTQAVLDAPIASEVP